jgi:selenocysteine-specific elongation factor
MHVIGTAGHVDHGKSALVRALTGIDPDRLAEERERGLTIDLGFAWFTLPSGEEVSIVDVPGHERFIKNMLAGAGGVELALLVVAADEGPMPQTLEHLAILDRLDVPGGIVVVTKSDLVEQDFLELVQLEVREALAGSCLADAPILAASALTGAGLPELVAAIDVALTMSAPRRDLRRPRVPIDRVFTIQGFGTVVTGTLVDGALEVGDEVEIQPAGLRARIRGLQRHKAKVARLEPGTRAAVNLSGVAAEQLARGMVLSHPSTLRPARTLDVYLTATPVMRHPLPHDAVVTVLAATAEAQARVRLLDASELDVGSSCWAQLVLDSEIVVLPGDRCILRTPNDTVAGGEIVGINPRRHRRDHAPTLEALALARMGSPAQRLLQLLASGPGPADELSRRLESPEAEVRAAISDLLRSDDLVQAGGRLYSVAWLDAARSRLSGAVRDYLSANPLRRSAPREHVRSQVRWAPEVLDQVVADAVSRGLLVESGKGGLAPMGYHITLDEVQRRRVDTYLAMLRSAPFSPPTDAPLPTDLTTFLEEEGLVVRTSGGVTYAREAMDEMIARTTQWCQEHGEVSLAEVRDMFATSRKYAQAFLEHLDELRVTRRVGDVRVLRIVPQATPD